MKANLFGRRLDVACLVWARLGDSSQKKIQPQNLSET